MWLLTYAPQKWINYSYTLNLNCFNEHNFFLSSICVSGSITWNRDKFCRVYSKSKRLCFYLGNGFSELLCWFTVSVHFPNLHTFCFPQGISTSCIPNGESQVKSKSTSSSVEWFCRYSCLKTYCIEPWLSLGSSVNKIKMASTYQGDLNTWSRTTLNFAL